MKNGFKLSFLALAVSLSIAACKGNGSANSADTAKDTSKVNSSTSMKSTADTTIKIDSSKATDTSKAKLDTVSKSVTKHTVVKKTAVKTN